MNTDLTYANITEVLHNPIIIVFLILIWLIPLLIYFLVGFLIKKKSPNGKIYSKPMISSANFWVAPLIWTITQAILFLLLLFPFWIIPFE